VIYHAVQAERYCPVRKEIDGCRRLLYSAMSESVCTPVFPLPTCLSDPMSRTHARPRPNDRLDHQAQLSFCGKVLGCVLALSLLIGGLGCLLLFALPHIPDAIDATSNAWVASIEIFSAAKASLRHMRSPGRVQWSLRHGRP